VQCHVEVLHSTLSSVTWKNNETWLPPRPKGRGFRPRDQMIGGGLLVGLVVGKLLFG
jgi:hypothetical protein